MSLTRSWRFIGSVGSPYYRVFDRLRRHVNTRLVAFLSGHLSGPKNGQGGRNPGAPTRVLEAGSGPGFASSLFAQRPDVATSICMDLDPAALMEARKRDASLPVVAGDLMQMPFSDNAFAMVFNSSTVEHLRDPAGAVREMQRVCDNHGRVFVGVPYLWGPLGIQPLIRSTRVGIWLGKVFSQASLDRLLSSGGLTPVAHLRYFWNFFIGAVAVKRVVKHDGGPSGET